MQTHERYQLQTPTHGEETVMPEGDRKTKILWFAASWQGTTAEERYAWMRFLDRAIDCFANLDSQRLLENRPGESKRMEFAILAARIHIRREATDEIRVDVPAQGRFIQISVIDAADHRAKTQGNKFTDQFA